MAGQDSRNKEAKSAKKKKKWHQDQAFWLMTWSGKHISSLFQSDRNNVSWTNCMSTDRWIKIWHIYIMVYYLSTEEPVRLQTMGLQRVGHDWRTNATTTNNKGWDNAICSCMDGPRDYHTKWKKWKRKRQIYHDSTYMWSLNYDRSIHIYEKETDPQI